MAVRKTMLMLMCLFCGALARSDVDAKNIYDLLSKVSDGQDITVDDLLPQSTIDDARVVQESLDDDLNDDLDDDLNDDLDDDLDDAINLELANKELLGGCRNRVCTFCTKKFRVKFCFQARFINMGFSLKFMANRRTLFRKEISVRNPPPICKGAPFVGRVCVRLYNVNIKRRSACVRVEFKVFFKKVNLKIACFKLGKREETSPLISTRMLQELVDEKLNRVE